MDGRTIDGLDPHQRGKRNTIFPRGGRIIDEQPNATVRLDSMKAIDQERNVG
jgi:hypothetical protein